MKKLFFSAAVILTLFCNQQVSAQNTGIGEPNPASKLSVKGNMSIGDTYSGVAGPTGGLIIEGPLGLGTSTPNSNAVLDMASTSKGVFLPRLSRSQRLAISNPTKGLMVFDTDSNTIFFHNGTTWFNFPAVDLINNTVVGSTTNLWGVGPAGPPGEGYGSTSTTSNTIGLGTKTIVTQTNQAYQVDDRLRISYNTSNYMEGLVVSYANQTITLNVVRIVGSGTYSSWMIGLVGDPGVTGATGATGPAGTNGTNGATGATGPQGIQGLQGVAGANGAAGATGPQGIQGVAGANGATGVTGPTGPSGADGLNGDIYATTSTTSNTISTGSKTFTVATGLDYTIGQPVIMANTSANTMTGTVTSYNASTGALVVNVTSVTGSGTKTSWSINLGGITGPAGANGVAGATGATGPQGIQGIAGTNGTNGATGATGPQGVAGTNGTNGATGPQGTAGVAGAAGATGANGATGAGYLATSTSSVAIGTGSKTFTTQSGLAYLAGDRVRVSNSASNFVEGTVTSYSGTSLVINADYTSGSGTLSSWNIGIAGIVGATGAAGSAGATGPQGPQGVAGTNGTNGTNGATGATGPQGIQGVAGATGATGPQGTAGPTVVSVSNSSSSNVLSTTVNGISGSGVQIVNAISNTSSANNLSTTVNGVTSVNVPIINSISNTSSGNNLTTTVNGVSSSTVSIINSNTTSLSGTNLTTTVNGVASTALDLSPIVTSKAWSLTGNSGTSAGTNFVGTTDNTDLVFKTNGTEKVRIQSNGLMGIGCQTVPTNKWIVASSLAAPTFTSAANGFGACFPGGAGFYVKNSTDNVEGKYESYNGKVHIGVASNVYAPLVFYTEGSTESARLDASGNFGIGTSAPGQKLDVADGNLIISNNGTAGMLMLEEPSASGSNYTAFKAGAQSANITYTLPAADGSSGQFLSTNGSGTLAWSTAATGSYIANSSTAQAGANFNVGGNGTIGGALSVAGSSALSGSMSVGGAATLSSTLGVTGATSLSSTLAVTGASTLTGGATLGAALALPITTITTNLTLTASHYTVIITGSTPTITLPAASTATGRVYVIVNQTAAARTISSYKSLGGLATTTVPTVASVMIQSDGTNWYQIK